MDFSSLYISENWVDSYIFNGNLSKIKNAFNDEIKTQMQLLKQEKVNQSPTEKENKSVLETVKTDMTKGVANAPQIQIAETNHKIDMEEIPQLIFLETDNSSDKFHFSEIIFNYNIEDVSVNIKKSSDNTDSFDNEETVSVDEGVSQINEMLKHHADKNMHISIMHENGDRESLTQYVNRASYDYPMIESFFNNSIQEFANPLPDNKKAPKSKIYTVDEYNALLKKASENISDGQSFKLHFKVILSEKRNYSETFELTKETGKLSEILTSSESNTKYNRNFLKSLKMISEKENNSEISKKSENKSTGSELSVSETQKYPYVSVKFNWKSAKYFEPEIKEKNYTIPEFNNSLQKLSERWDGDEYEGKSAFITLTIHISETESFEKRLYAEYQFEKLSEFLEYDDDIFDTEVKLRQTVREAENQSTENNSEKTDEQLSLFNEISDADENKNDNDKIPENEKSVSELTEKKKTTNSKKLYNQFTEMFPNIVSGEHTHERYGNTGDAYEPLAVEHLGGNTYSFMTYFVQNGDLMRDPDFTFKLDHENKTLNILEYQQDGSAFGTVYQRVYDENNNPDLKLLSALEKNFMQNLKNAQNMERPLAAFTDKDGNKSEFYPEQQTIEQEEPEINDNTPELRTVLNEFSEKYGLGELNVEPERYNWKLTEKFNDGTKFTLGEITNPEYDKPFTSNELKSALEKFENQIQSRGQNIAEIYNRNSIAENHGGISERPKVQENLPEIVYADRPSEKISNNISAIRF